MNSRQLISSALYVALLWIGSIYPSGAFGSSRQQNPPSGGSGGASTATANASASDQNSTSSQASPAATPDAGAMQDQDSTAAKHTAQTGMDVPSPDQRLAKMTKKYNLTSDQQSRIKPILEDEQQQMQAMHSDTSMAPKDRHAKMMSMRQEDSQKIEAVLNDDQKKMFEADQQKMEQKMAMRHKHMEDSMEGDHANPANGGKGGASTEVPETKPPQ